MPKELAVCCVTSQAHKHVINYQVKEHELLLRLIVAKGHSTHFASVFLQQFYALVSVVF